MPWHFCAVGRGRPVAEWAALIAALADVGYGGPISVEHEDPDLDPETGITASIAGLISARDIFEGGVPAGSNSSADLQTNAYTEPRSA
jgi:hypothetical protein